MDLLVNMDVKVQFLQQGGICYQITVFYDSPSPCIVASMNKLKNKSKSGITAKVFLNFVVISVGVCGLFAVAGYAWFDYAMRPVGNHVAFKVVYVPAGFKASQIGKLLADEGIIRSRRTFELWTKVTGKQSKLWAGYYNLSPHFSGQFVVKVLTEHTPYSRLVRVTIPEGYSLSQIAHVLESKNLSKAEVFSQYVKHDAKMELLVQFPWMAMIPTRNLEGVLYPDTYLFPPSASKQLIVKTMLTAFSRQILPIWNAASPNVGLNFYGTLTLASIVEKEAVVRDEMPLIAGVFVNRLARRMPLGSDPTVVYALGLTWKDTVFYRDLKVASPYNTYRNKGLPPTPIASPGVHAFKASLEPASTSFLFFVASKSNDGRHIFTETYREHLAAQR